MKHKLWRLYIWLWRSLGMGVYEDKRWDRDGEFGRGPDGAEEAR